MDVDVAMASYRRLSDSGTATTAYNDEDAAAARGKMTARQRMWVCAVFVMVAVMVAVIIILIAAGRKSNDQPPSLCVPTANGVVQGYTNGSVDVFLGIPYAQPPTGALRWRPPQPPTAWNGVLPTMVYAPVCMQLHLSSPTYTYLPGTTMSEDCLYLNVWRPTGMSSSSSSSSLSSLDVLVWVHGGSLTSGSGTEMELVGKAMATRGQMVVVTVNYRMGVMGFLALDELLQTDGSTGNYGLQDQRAALQWVHDNIQAFGGDPQKVTIAGESAGASSVALHLVMQRSFGLFHRAVTQSSASFVEIKRLNESTTQGRLVRSALGCTTVACMRDKSAADVMTAQRLNASEATATIDGHEFVDHPAVSFKRGDFAPNVALMQGNVLNEGSVFIYPANPEPISLAQYHVKVAAFFPLQSAAWVADVCTRVYPCHNVTDCRPELTTLFGDFMFYCPSMLMGMYMAAGQPSLPVYSYMYEHVASYNNYPPFIGVYHASEIAFVFGTMGIYQPHYTADELQLSNRMMDAWTEFAKTSRVAAWPQFSNATQWDRQLLNITMGTVSMAKYAVCQFWAPLYQLL